jgi:hypothetical protein
MSNSGLLTGGDAGPEVERREGLPERRAEFRAFARRIVNDENYQQCLLERMREGSISPAVERLLLEAAYCSVKSDEQGGAEEALRALEMRKMVEQLASSSRARELDARTMGARRVLRLPPNVVKETPHDDSAA